MVIGNASYQNSPLKNPISDASSIENALKKLGFKVFKYTNLKKRSEFENIITRHFSSSDQYNSTLFFYAGHGMQLKNNNYLVPTDVRLENPEDVISQCYPLSDILEKSKSKVNIIFLDACRNNNFGITSSSGLAHLQYNNDSNFFIGYATSPNAVAQDGTGSNSIYTQAILKYIHQPVDIFKFHTEVNKGVREQTQDQQIPWQSGSLSVPFYFSD